MPREHRVIRHYALPEAFNWRQALSTGVHLARGAATDWSVPVCAMP